MRFINLVASDVWTDADITRRTEAMVRSEFSASAELILNRKLQGAALGAYTLTPDDGAEVQRFNAVVLAAQAAGAAARADMALLAQVLALEAATDELAALPDDDDHAGRRAELQAQLADAPDEVLALADARAQARQAAEEAPAGEPAP